MKKITLIILLAASTWCALQSQVLAGADTNVAYLKIMAASNNVPQIIQALPDVEKLWPQDTDAYLKSINQAARVLDNQLNSRADAMQVFTNMFAEIMQKKCPTNEEAAASWIAQKREMVFFFVVHDQVGQDKANWIAAAKFLGEIRSKRIPNYVNQSMMISVAMPDHPEVLQKMIADNERKKVADNFQSELWQADSTLLFLLQHSCPFTQAGKPIDTNFISQLSSAAHLTEAEQKEFSH